MIIDFSQKRLAGTARRERFKVETASAVDIPLSLSMPVYGRAEVPAFVAVGNEPATADEMKLANWSEATLAVLTALRRGISAGLEQN